MFVLKLSFTQTGTETSWSRNENTEAMYRIRGNRS